LYFDRSPTNHNVANSLRLGIVAEFVSNVDILDIECVEVRIDGEGARRLDLYCRRGSRAL
jgi:hypothetical protein